MVIIVNVVALLLIILIIWWFWFYKPKAVKLVATGRIKVMVENGVYSPDVIHTAVNQPLTIEFVLKDESHCAGTVIFSDFGVSKELQLNQTETIELKPTEVGEFAFHCPMNMYQGKLVVDTADQVATQTIDVIVDGGIYEPGLIHIPVGVPVTLRFIRKDEGHCASTLVFEDFGISEEILVNEPKEIVITAESPGTYKFGCSMGMYQGQLIAQ